MPYKYKTKLNLNMRRAALEKKKQVQKEQQGSDVESSEEDDEEEEQDNDDDGQDKDLSLTTDEGLSRYVLEACRHDTHPALNLGLGQAINSQNPLNLYPSAALTVPLPLYVCNRTTPIVDPCLRRPIVHDEWMRQMGVYKSRFHSHTKKQKHRERRQKEQVYNIHLYDVAEHIAAHDNVYFRDSYDYYYTGGSLNLMQYVKAGEEAKTLALHLSGKKLQQLHVSQVGMEAELWNPLHTASLEDMSSEIFELLPISTFRVNHGNMFIARLLNDICIYELMQVEEAVHEQNSDDDEEVEEQSQQQPKYELSCQGKYSSEAGPFISVAQAINRASTLAVACEDRSLRFMDLETHKDISKHDVRILKGVDKGISNWAQVRAWQENCFNYVCQSLLLTIDMRCATEAINPCFASSVYSKHCESFSCLARSGNPHLLYVASNHKLHCLDMRCLGKKLTDRAVVTWTHQMEVSPTYMDALVHEGSEYVALGSVLASDQRICEMKGAMATSFTSMHSPSLPLAPPQLSEALMEARLNGCIDIYADLAERIKGSTTGLKFHRLENASDGAFAQLLTSNSVGDVYCQRVTLRDEQEMQREERTGTHTHEVIKYYGELVEKHVKRPLHCTMMQSMPAMREIMDLKPQLEDEKPLIAEDIHIDYGFDSSKSESEEVSSSQEKQKTKKKPKKKTKKKLIKETSKELNGDAVKSKGVNRGPWQKSAHYLSRFTDVISTRMLSIWDIDEFDQTRDVEIDMIDEKLKKDKKEEEEVDVRTANWLQQIAEEPVPEEKPAVVPGTDLPTYFQAVYAEYREELQETVEIDEAVIVPKTEPNTSFNESISFSRPACSTLKPNEFTIIENNDWNSNPNPIKSPPANPTPAKRRKIKHTMGF